MVDGKWDKLITPKADLLRYVRKGVLWVNKAPVYIVDLIKEHDVSYVIVYGVQPGTEKNPQKRTRTITITQNQFSTKTVLGQLANSLVPRKTNSKVVTDDPLFIAPVVPNQVSTFTGKREAGFFEREPDTVTTVAGERKYIRGKNTGVFVGLSSIVWDSKYTIPTESILNVLTQYKKNQGGFFDLEGNNNDKNNPLSQFYKGIK